MTTTYKEKLQASCFGVGQPAVKYCIDHNIPVEDVTDVVDYIVMDTKTSGACLKVFKHNNKAYYSVVGTSDNKLIDKVYNNYKQAIIAFESID